MATLAAHQDDDLWTRVSVPIAYWPHRVDDICCSRVVKGGVPNGPTGVSDRVAADARRIRVSCRTTRSSRYPRRQDRSLRGHHRDPADGHFFSCKGWARPRRSAGTRRRRRSPHTIDSCDAAVQPAGTARWAPPSTMSSRRPAAVTSYLMPCLRAAPTEIYKVGLVSVQLLLAVGDLLIGLASAGPGVRSRRPRWRPIRRAPISGSTRARSPPPTSSAAEYAPADHRGARAGRGGRHRS